jgi:threonine/homoserine/homoserine lactone efflux protein
MLSLYAITGFLVAVFPLVATPGASFTLLTQRVGSGGRREGLPVALGTMTGLYVHATLAGAGLSAVVMGSSQLFGVVKFLGALYLIVLGVWTWRSATVRPVDAAPRRSVLPWTGHSTYVQALLGNVLNPKAASIYLTLLPQFLIPGQPVFGQVLVLATAHAILMALWLFAWTAAIGTAAQVLTSGAFKPMLNRITGGVLIALGVKSALA